MKIFITGIAGFLGSAMAVDLRAAGHAVEGSRRGMALGAETLRDVDVVIHAAYDFTRGAGQKNVELTTAWFQAAHGSGVRQQIFLSSCSAGPESEYGHVKEALEPLFLGSGGTIVRPGLVMGAGGLYQRQRAAILRSPVIPMVGGGRQATAVLGIEEFVAAIRWLVERGLRGEYTLYRTPMPTYREFVAGIKRDAGQRARFVNVPTGLAMAVTGALERLRIPFPVKAGQIRALTAGPRGASRLSELQ